jgi:TPR repeat protein
LGWLFVLGQGVSRDDQQALVLFREAAATGYPNAQDSLGWMYQHGRGVNKDLAAAREWYAKAASQGFKKSQENLATL